MPKKKKPAYLLHKPSGQARVRIDGADHYLGPYGSPESRDRYDDLIADWCRRNGDTRSYALTIDELAILYMDYAKGYYLKRGKPTSEVHNMQIALRPLVDLFGTLRVREFTPKKLKAVREAMIDAGCVRTSINRQIGRIKRVFRWGVENELLPPDVYAALTAVPGLKRGRSRARESEPVKPVPDAHVEAVKPHVSHQVWAMIQVQILTGARPGEVVMMRGCDLKLTGEVWEYHPDSYKTEHHDKDRVILLGPPAQEIIRKYLKPDLEAYLFSPLDAKAEFQARRRENRKTPMTPSQRGRRRKEKPKRVPGSHYTVLSYRRAIVRACEKVGVPSWHPHQLRHNAGTAVRRMFGIEASKNVLGVGSLNVAEVYAERDRYSPRPKTALSVRWALARQSEDGQECPSYKSAITARGE